MNICDDKIEIEDHLDNDGELEITIHTFSELDREEYGWLKKDDAKLLIEHLKRVFGI